MPTWLRARATARRKTTGTARPRRWLPSLPLLVLVLVLALALDAPVFVLGAVLSPQADAELAELHAAMEEGFALISNLTSELQAARAIPASQTAGSGTLGGAGGELGTKPGVAPEKIAAIRKLETDFAALQQTAFRIGRESQDNTQLSRHPDLNNYVQSLRDFQPRLNDMISDLEKEAGRIMGKEVKRTKKRRKSAKTIRGLSENDIRSAARKAVAGDGRSFRAKAMDMVSTFRERQLQMQDKQRDLQLAMDGPDWPKEDWPLSTADAKHVGDAEQMIQVALRDLNAKIEPSGGLPRVHESGDESALEQIAAVSAMMSGYVELIDRHVDAVKKVYRNKKKRKTPAAAVPGGGGSGAAGGTTLRDRLLSFGSPQEGQQQRPFSWLHGDQDAVSPPASGSASPRAFDSPGLQHKDGSPGLQQPGLQQPRGIGSSGFANSGQLPGPHQLRDLNSGGLAHGGGGGAATSASRLPGLAKLAGIASTLGGFGTGAPGLASAAAPTLFGAQSPQAPLGAAGGYAGGLGGGGGAFGAQHLPPQPRGWAAAQPVHGGGVGAGGATSLGRAAFEL